MENNLESERLKLEQYKARLDYDRLNLARYKIDFGLQRLLFETVIRFSILAIKTLLIINSVATLTLFAFLGYTYTSPNPFLLKAFHNFGIGVIAAVLTVAIAYLTQVFYSETKSERLKRILGNIFRIFAIFFALFSLTEFSMGLSLTKDAFLNKAGINCPELHPSPIDYLNAGAPYAWPVLAFFAFILILILFSSQIGEKIKTLTKVGKDGATFSPTQQEENAAEKQTKQPLKDPPNKDPSVQIWVTQLENEIADRKFDNDDLIARLKWALATALRNALFERISRLIFGTQISALRRMSTTDGMTDAELQVIHAEHLKRVGDQALDFIAWRGFLESNELVAYDSSKLKITDKGKLYLNFANAIGVDERKNG